MDQIEMYFKLKINYDAYRLERTMRLLQHIELNIFKLFDYDEELIDKYFDSIKSKYLHNKDKLKHSNNLSDVDYKRLKKSVDTINKVLMKNGYEFHLLPYLEYDDYLKQYPIDIDLVDKK